MMTSKCTSIEAHFQGLADAPSEQYRWHCPMQHVQGYSKSHWTLPLGDYLLRIAPAAARATANKTTKKWTSFAGQFNGRSGAPVQYRMHQLMEEVQGFGRSPWMPPHWASIVSDRCNWSGICQFFSSFFIVNLLVKVAGQC